MRLRPVALLFLVVLVAGCNEATRMPEDRAGVLTGEAALEAAGGGAPDGAWHLGQSLSSEAVRYAAHVNDCTRCHYGLRDYWTLEPEPVWDGDLSWNVSVRPLFPHAGMYGVQLLEPGVEPVLWDSGDVNGTWSAGEERSLEFQVPPGAGGVVAYLYDFVANEARYVSLVGGYDAAEVAATLTGPDGTVHEPLPVTGPDQALIVAAGDLTPGTWTLHARHLSAPPDGMELHMRVRVLAGGVHAEATGGAPATFTVPPGPDGRPEPRVLHAWLHFDHDDVERDDYDAVDLSPWRTTVTSRPGDGAARAWSPAEVDAAWGGRGEVLVGTWGLDVPVPAYADPDDRALYWWHAGDPVPPGTQRLRIEAFVPRSPEETGFHVVASPPTMPYLLLPETVLEEAGRVVYELEVEPAWWEDPHQPAWGSERSGPRNGTWQFFPRGDEEPEVAGLGSKYVVNGIRVYAVRAS